MFYLPARERLLSLCTVDVSSSSGRTAPAREGRAELSAQLPRGSWTLDVRYSSSAGIGYREPSPEIVVTVPPAPAENRRP